MERCEHHGIQPGQVQGPAVPGVPKDWVVDGLGAAQEKELGILVDGELDMSCLPGPAAQKSTCAMGYVKRSLASKLREGFA